MTTGYSVPGIRTILYGDSNIRLAGTFLLATGVASSPWDYAFRGTLHPAHRFQGWLLGKAAATTLMIVHSSVWRSSYQNGGTFFAVVDSPIYHIYLQHYLSCGSPNMN